MTGAQPDGEATFGGGVDEVSSRAKVVRKISIRTHGRESGRRSAIAVFADQRVDGPVFAKLFYAGRQDDQLRTISQCHACAVDGLVAQPCTVKLMRIEINDSFLHGRVHGLEVHFQAERGGTVKAVHIVADEKSAYCQTSIRHESDNGEYVDDGQVSQETIGCVSEDVAHGVVCAAHDALHPVNRTQVMAPVYALAASRAHENILRVVGHAYHFMGHDLADRENKIEVAMDNEPVHLCRPRVVQLAFRLLADELGRDLAQSLDVRTPVMH